jgi:hypothetical protein
MRAPLLLCGVALCAATATAAARPKLSDLPQGKRAEAPKQALPSSVPGDATVPGLNVRPGTTPPETADKHEALGAADFGDSMQPRVARAVPEQARHDIERARWVTAMPKTGCVSQPNHPASMKALELRSESGVVMLELTRVQREGKKDTLRSMWVAVDTKTRGAKLLREQRTDLKRLGTGAGKFVLYGYRSAHGIELVASAPGTQMQAAGKGVGGISQCGLLQTTLSTKSNAAVVDIGAERQLPLTKDEKRDVARGVAVTTHMEASFAHVSVSKLGRDHAPVLSVVVRKESGHRFSAPTAPRPVMHGMLR